MGISPKWKTLAAKAASAPAWKASEEVLHPPGPAAGDHRDPHRLGHHAGEPEVVPLLGPVPVHAGEEDLPGPKLHPLHRPLHGVEARGHAPPATWTSGKSPRHLASMARTTAWAPK